MLRRSDECLAQHAIDCGMAGQAFGADGKAVDLQPPDTADVKYSKEESASGQPFSSKANRNFPAHRRSSDPQEIWPEKHVFAEMKRI